MEPMKNCEILLRARYVLTQDATRTVLENAAVAVDHGRIVGVGPSDARPYDADAVRDLMLLKKSDEMRLSFYADRTEALELSDRASLLFLDRLLGAILGALEENDRNANLRLCLMHMAISAELI